MNEDQLRQEKRIKKIYKYLEENKDKDSEKTYKKLEEELKKVLLKNYQEKIISKEFFEEYNEKIKELGEEKKTKAKKSILPEIIGILIVVSVLITVLYFIPFERTVKIEPSTTAQASMPTTPPPKEIIVADNHPNADYGSIQEAINNARNGDVIKVYPGEYEGGVYVDKSLTLIGVNMPVIHDSFQRNTGKIRLKQSVGITILADRCTIKGFKIKSCNIGIDVHSDFNKILNNIFSNNNKGLSINLANRNTIEGNTFSDNDFGIHLSKGIYFYETCHNNKITHNAFSKNGIGVFLIDSDDNTITNNTFSANDKGIYLRVSSKNTIKFNDFLNNIYGICLIASNGNTIEENKFSDNEKEDIIRTP